MHQVYIHHPMPLLQKVRYHVLSCFSRSPRKKYTLFSHEFSCLVEILFFASKAVVRCKFPRQFTITDYKCRNNGILCLLPQSLSHLPCNLRPKIPTDFIIDLCAVPSTEHLIAAYTLQPI